MGVVIGFQYSQHVAMSGGLKVSVGPSSTRQFIEQLLVVGDIGKIIWNGVGAVEISPDTCLLYTSDAADE